MPTLPDIYRESRTIAVVGLSEKPERASHEVAEYLQRQGYRIIPVNPAQAGKHILSEHCYATLKEAAIDLGQQGVVIDVVNGFRKPEAMPELAEQAIAIGARTLWMPLGVVNEAAANAAQKAGMTVVMDRCMKIEHGKWLANG